MVLINGQVRRFCGTALASLFLMLASCDSVPDLTNSSPETFNVIFGTSAGPFEVEFVREWSPVAVDRVWTLARMGYWEGSRIYRVNDNYAQFGYSGQPSLDAEWVQKGLVDEPTRESNVRGSVSFARGGIGSRSSILFINRSDNSYLDELSWLGVVGFPPVGRVISGMEAVDGLYAAYGDDPMQWEDSIAASGNAFLGRRFPRLDSIMSLEVR
ncbi:MAG: peptidylprolyl isomerase [Myxococcales bacterium]|nr:peptidylprolyl isomerase [Myxococcales bacterium]